MSDPSCIVVGSQCAVLPLMVSADDPCSIALPALLLSCLGSLACCTLASQFISTQSFIYYWPLGTLALEPALPESHSLPWPSASYLQPTSSSDRRTQKRGLRSRHLNWAWPRPCSVAPSEWNLLQKWLGEQHLWLSHGASEG